MRQSPVSTETAWLILQTALVLLILIVALVNTVHHWT